GHPLLAGIAESLSARVPGCADLVKRILGNEALVGGTEEEAAAIGLGILRQLSQGDVGTWFPLARPYGPASKLDEALETIREVFLEPLYEYVDESLDEERAMLALLFRYKHRCEWFHRARLWELTQTESRKTETPLALDLYSYLHDQGINFNIEPSSLTGEVDLIAAQGSSDPLLADVKVFDAVNRGKAYIRK